jgi:hypothetical protein
MIARMRMMSHPLTSANVVKCRELWGDRAHYTPDELHAIVTRAAHLLSENRARGTLLVDEQQRLRYFGLTVFVAPAVAMDLMREPRPHIGSTLLSKGGGESAILDERAIGRGNAGTGLHMVVVNQGWDVSDSPEQLWPALIGSLLKEFQQVHAGFRLAAIVGETFGADGVAVVLRSGVYPQVQEFETAALDASRTRSVVFCLTREQAIERWSPLLPMFSYTAPQALFTRAECRLLRESLSGATDADLARRLRMSLSAVKSTWTRLYARLDRIPSLQAEPHRTSLSRGAQRRHRVLEYVRCYPSELNPYEPAFVDLATPTGSPRSGRHAVHPASCRSSLRGTRTRRSSR